jgi:heat shock protein beta
VYPCSPKDIDDEEYNNFYEMFSKDSKDPMARTHFVAEGEVTFRSILFVPGVSLGVPEHSKSNIQHLTSIR